MQYFSYEERFANFYLTDTGFIHNMTYYEFCVIMSVATNSERCYKKEKLRVLTKLNKWCAFILLTRKGSA